MRVSRPNLVVAVEIACFALAWAVVLTTAFSGDKDRQQAPREVAVSSQTLPMK